MFKKIHIDNFKFIIILLLFFSCEGEYSKTIIKYDPIEIEIFKPSPNSKVYHLTSNNTKIEEKFIDEIYKNDSMIIIKSYKNKNGYVDKDSTFIYKYKKIIVEDSIISKEQYNNYLKNATKIWSSTLNN